MRFKTVEEKIIDMDDDSKEVMVSNLLVVLTCESQPNQLLTRILY